VIMPPTSERFSDGCERCWRALILVVDFDLALIAVGLSAHLALG
jgi:hypothetical protein